jgi:hypothetical protein
MSTTTKMQRKGASTLSRGTNNKVVYLTKRQKHRLIFPVGLFLAGIMTSYGIYDKE